MSNETMDLMETRIRENLILLETEKDEDQRVRLIREVEKLSTKLTEAENSVFKYDVDKAAAELDSEKSKRLANTEKKKMILEASAKVVGTVIPAAISLITLSVWGKRFEQMMKFEETGRVVSTASRVLKFPNVF